ncbi:VOC family protein [Phytomonospora sp. NPDC050363]|uniref:VOC family protein n=1 Tax=Phytomonospora sp. NPDC050363 TaxID=3155642 RepID=UPI0033EAF662
MNAIAKPATITLDCADPAALADFYRQVTGWGVTYSDDDTVYLGDGGVQLGFQRVAGYTAPVWPQDPAGAHVDFSVADVAVAVKELTGLGATVPAEQPGGDDWTVLVDPSGHVFCLSSG